MSAMDRGLSSLSFLPDALRDALHRRLREIAGIGLIILSVALGLALATWSVQDPSLSHATNAPVRNALGFGGAIVADLLTQLFGLAALALVLPIAIWGWRLASHRPLSRERIRLAFWMLGVPLWAACAAALPRSAAWPLPAGLGGVTGDWMWRLPAFVAGGSLSDVPRAVAVIALAFAALVCLAVVAGFGVQSHTADAEDDQESEPRAAISIGWIAHGFLSFKARLRRLLTRRSPMRLAVPREVIALERRSEPNFGASAAATLAPRMELEDDDEDAAPSRPKPRAVPRAQRRAGGGYVLPPLELLAAPKA